jgi:hypothetical protein
LNNPETGTDGLLDLLILMRKQRDCVGYIVPFALGVAARQPSSKFFGKLFGIFILKKEHLER